ncbi:MAG: glutamine-synthetase adenylyltransferase, partial [Pseudomonadota bacterium]
MPALADRELDRTRVPQRYDGKAAEALRTRWLHRAQRITDAELREFALEVWDHPQAGPMLGAIGDASNFLSDCFLNDPQLLRDLVGQGHEPVWAQTIDQIGDIAITQRNPLMAALRRARTRAAAVIAWADLSGAWQLDEITQALSAVADATIRKAADYLIAEAQHRRDLEPPDSEQAVETNGVIVIAMGKLGAFELNYSSDIDLIVLFDPERIRYRGPESPMAFAVRFARSLSHLLEHRTNDGYVLRVDLRLRPRLPWTALADVRADE